MFWMSVLLFLLLLAGLLGNTFGIYAKYQLLKGKYFRYTNILLLVQSLFFLGAAPFWYWVINGKNITANSADCTEYGSFIIVLPAMGFLLLICYAWGRYYANKLDYAQAVKNLLQDSEDIAERNQSEEIHTEVDTDLKSEDRNGQPQSAESEGYM